MIDVAKLFTIAGLSKQVIGEIKPTGRHEEDLDRLENLANHTELTLELVVELMKNVPFAQRPESTVKGIGEQSIKDLTQIRDLINDVIPKDNDCE